MSEKKISVIMSTYNEKEIWVKEAVDSILNQTVNDFEFIIIVDKPDNNKIIDLLHEYEMNDKRVKVYINNKNLGLVKSLNKAIRLSNGKFIARMDADDYSYPQRFEKQLNLLQNNPDVSLCATGVIIVDEDGKELYKAKTYGITPKKAKRSLIYRNIFPHGSWMFRKEVLNTVSGYNEISQAEDYDLLFRMLDNDMNMLVIPEYLFKYRLRMNGISYKNLYKQKKMMIDISSQYKAALKSNSKYSFKDNSSSYITQEEIDKYSYYQELYTDAITQIRKKNIIVGGLNIIKVFIGCKFKRNELKSSVFLKIINKF